MTEHDAIAVAAVVAADEVGMTTCCHFVPDTTSEFDQFVLNAVARRDLKSHYIQSFFLFI